MRTTLLVIAIVFSVNQVWACSCGSWKGFIPLSSEAELVVKAKVLKHIYYSPRGKVTTIDKLSDTEFYGHSILVEVIEVLKGKESRRQFEIYGGIEWKYVSDCMMKLIGIDSGKTYVFSLFNTDRTNHSQPRQDIEDYSVYACGQSFVEYLEQSDSLKGYLKGKFTEKKREQVMEFKKFIRHIT